MKIVMHFIIVALLSVPSTICTSMISYRDYAALFLCFLLDPVCRAVLWLKRAVEQLLQSRGVTYEPNHHILSNVHNLFHCEMCPKIAI